MKKHILREPLVHFVVLGALIFAAYTRASTFTGEAPENIVVTRGQIESLAMRFSSSWQRPPAPEELDGLIRDRVQEEVYYREAIALGLDRDDTVIRRRLRQKLEFISDDNAAQTVPTDAELEAYLAEHPEKFRDEPRITFFQVYLNPERRGAQLSRDTALLLSRLPDEVEAAADILGYGDELPLEHVLHRVSSGEIAKQFGREFAASLGQLTPGQWHGPVRSGYGVHLVFISQRSDNRVPSLNDIRDAVHREWANAKRVEANEHFYQTLLQRYHVTIEGAQTRVRDR